MVASASGTVARSATSLRDRVVRNPSSERQDSGLRSLRAWHAGLIKNFFVELVENPTDNKTSRCFAAATDAQP